ncbi:MAG: alanine racemase [Bacillota bacterium]
MQYRNAQVIIDLDAIKQNIVMLKTKLPRETEIFAVVKADGYGHGSVEVARAALRAGASALCVAILEEAIILREAGIDAPILVMGYTDPAFSGEAERFDIQLTAFQLDWLEEAKRHITDQLNLHIKLDTGMGRLGLRTIEDVDVFLEAVDDPPFNVVGVFTHFAKADAADDTYYHYQAAHYRELIQPIKQRYGQSILYHTGNSAASLQFPADMYDAVRFGIGMYGLYPSIYLRDYPPFELQPALSLTTQLVHVKQLPQGEKISYGLTYTTETDEWIGTIPVGYGDGIQRRFQNFDVLIEGKRMPIVGRVCMDQCMVKLDQAYPVGTKVTFIGKDKEEQITLEEVAEHLGTINYEVSCLLTSRLPRLYRNESRS